MPIFSKKFDVKTLPSRGKRHAANCPSIQEKLDDYETISVNLPGQRQLKFVDGEWLLTTQASGNVDDINALKRKVHKLEEENNLNQVKVDVLLDMLTENLAELDVLRKADNWKICTNSIIQINTDDCISLKSQHVCFNFDEFSFHS